MDSKEKQESAESIRKKRLAYFTSGKSISLNEENDVISSEEGSSLKEKTAGNLERDAGGWDETYSSNSQNSVDSFEKIKEQLKQEALTASEDGYNELVEKLILSAKRDIARREKINFNYSEVKYDLDLSHSENSPKKAHVRRDSGSHPLDQEIVKSATEVKNTSQKSENSNISDNYGINKSQGSPRLAGKKLSSDNHLSRSYALEEIFSEKHLFPSKKKNVLKESLEEDAPNIFQKSVDIEHIGGLGLNTHRPESEEPRRMSIHSEHLRENEIEFLMKQMSPRVMEELRSDEIRFALGEQKYTDFLRKSVSEIDKIQKEKLSERSTKQGKTKPLIGDNKKISQKPPVDKKQLQIKTSGHNLQKAENLGSHISIQKDSDGNVEALTEVTNDTLTEITRTDNETVSEQTRPLLHRPKYEPIKTLASDKDGDEKRSVDRNSSASVRNYEQVTVPRNVVFSSSQIYEQAFQKGQNTNVPMNVMNGHFYPPPLPPQQQEWMKHVYMQQQMMPQYGQGYDNMMHFYQNFPYPGGHPQYSMQNFMHPTYPGQVYQSVPNSPMAHGPSHEAAHYDPLQLLSYRSSHSMDGGDSSKSMNLLQNSGNFPRPPVSKAHPPMAVRPPMNPNHQSFPPEFIYPNMHAWGMNAPRAPGHENTDGSHPYMYGMPHGYPYFLPGNGDPQAYYGFQGPQGFPLTPTSAPQDATPSFFRSMSWDGRIPQPPPPKKPDDVVSLDKVPHPPSKPHKWGSSPRRNSASDAVGRLPHQRTSKDKASHMHQFHQDISAEEIKSSQRHIDGIRQFHEQRRQEQEEEDAYQEKQKNYAKASLDRYFNSLEQLYTDGKEEEELKNSSYEEGKIEQNVASDQSLEINEKEVPEDTEIYMEKADTQHNEDEKETIVNTEVSLPVGGITDRAEKLGIDLSFLRESHEAKDVNDAAEEKGKDGHSSKEKTVLQCPECGEYNKVYMRWCGDCGEMLTGIEPVLAKKALKKKKLSKTKMQSKADKNVKFVSKDTLEIPSPVGAPGEDSSNLSVSPKLKGSPNKSDSRDSGRPSSEDLEVVRTEQEVLDICESINDPLVKGFVKNYLGKKSRETKNKIERVTEIEPQSFKEDDEISNKGMSGPKDINTGFDNMEDQSISKAVETEDPWLHEHETVHKPDRPLRGRKSGSLDIEIYSIEVSRESRSSSRRDFSIPVLNLANSSDEEDDIPKKPNQSKILSYSIDSTDSWQDFFEPPPAPPPTEPAPPPKEETPPPIPPLLAQIIGDQTGQTKISKGKTSVPKSEKEPTRSNSPVRSKVRNSLDSSGYQRKWEKSSIAWSSYAPGELSTQSSFNKSSNSIRPRSAKARSNGRKVNGTASVDISNANLQDLPDDLPGDLNNNASQDTPVNRKSRPQSANSSNNRPPRSSSADGELSTRATDKSPSRIPVSSSVSRTESPSRKKVPIDKKLRPRSAQKTNGYKVNSDESPRSLPYVVDHRLPAEEVVEENQSTQNNPDAAKHAYQLYQEMTPRIQQGKFSAWLCLPEEILLYIFSYLPHSDLVKAAAVCSHFHRVAMDSSLWRYITIKKNHWLTDESLLTIGKRQPVSLALIQCHGDEITAKGLRDLFRECGNTLQELNFAGCSRGALTGDCILMHASARCQRLTHVDASWCHVTDSGIGAISGSAEKLECLCINGCQNISDDGLEVVIKKHCKSLRHLEMFGCFNITPRGMRYLGTHCLYLKTLNLGQCYKLTDSCIAQLSSSLGRIEMLDLRGCKQIKDNCMRYIVKNCPRLQTISLANCPNISDVSMLEISTYINDIRTIDACGCRNVTDNSIRALANNCQNLRNIDISSTGCTHRSVSMLANFCNQKLETVKLNFLTDVSEPVLVKLAKHCRRLKLLHLYGCTSVRNVDKIREANPETVVEL